jgi:16S rRNA pseudouridine516 synthase
MKLDRLVASHQSLGRQAAHLAIAARRVRVDGAIITDGHHPVDRFMRVEVDAEVIQSPERALYLMLHKPVGYVCTHSDGEGPTIYELLPAQWLDRNPAVTSVGRLDKDTSGLLLVTDIGSLVHRYTSPKADVEKTYLSEVDRDLDPLLIEIFARGDLMLRGEAKPCLPARLEIISPRTARLTITEGRYHQVRRMFASQGYHVEKLHRESFGHHVLGELVEGEWAMLPVPV